MRVNFFRVFIAVYLIMNSCSFMNAQQIKGPTLEECEEMVLKNYPLAKQIDLLAKAENTQLNQLSKFNYPQITSTGQATKQSDVTSIPNPPAILNFPEISNNQFRVSAEISQSITDGFLVPIQKDLAKQNNISEIEKIKIEQQKISDQLVQIYFGILLLDAQLLQHELVHSDLISTAKTIKSLVSGGQAAQVNYYQIKAEEITINQQKLNLASQRKALIKSLSLLINQEINSEATFATPHSPEISGEFDRAEIRLLESQKKVSRLQSKFIHLKTMPRFNLFFLGGYGRPGLNMLSNDFAPFYVAGARFSWNIQPLFTKKSEQALINIQTEQLENQKKLFYAQIQQQISKQDEELNRIKSQITEDEEIIRLRSKIKQIQAKQLEQGIITTSEYLTAVHAEDQAKQNQLVHELQLKMIQYNKKLLYGK